MVLWGALLRVCIIGVMSKGVFKLEIVEMVTLDETRIFSPVEIEAWHVLRFWYLCNDKIPQCDTCNSSY